MLTVFPRAIPAAVGIDLGPTDYLLVYLVAAAELAAAVLSFGAARLSDRARCAWSLRRWSCCTAAAGC